MTGPSRERLFELLPALYRLRDAVQGEPLRALLGVVERERELLEDDIARLYDNWFIETCAEWVVPYLGDLLGVRGLLPVRGGAFSLRAFVANTLAYRRAKGTAAVLEQLARDVTGWPARAVEFFERLATTQHLNHVRPHSPGTASLRDADRLELVDGPFERVAHTAEVRHLDNGRGRYNIPNVGLFLWRLQSYAVTRGTARAVAQPADGRYTFSPLGHSTPLFNRPRTETALTQLAAEANVPGPLRRRPLHDELEDRRQALADGRTPPPAWFADPPVLQVFVDGSPVPPEEVVICDLSDPPASIAEGWRRPAATRRYQPAAGGPPRDLPIQLAVDPVLGRLAFPTGVTPARVEVSYAYGFSGDLGGGPYSRRDSLAKVLSRPVGWQVGVTPDAPAGHPQLVRTLTEAVQAWNGRPAGTTGVIAVLDSRTYREDLSSAAGTVRVPAGSLLVIAAADWPEEDVADAPGQKRRVVGRLTPDGLRPHLLGNLAVEGTAAASINPGELIIGGLLLEGTLTVRAGNLGGLRLAHTTLVPGLGGLTVQAAVPPGQTNDRLTVTLERCVTGPLKVAPTARLLRVEDCVVDGGTGAALAAPAAEVQTSTVVGRTDVRSLEAGNSIFTGPVNVARRQVGCVRYCYLPLGSLAPRRYQCQPRSAADAGRLLPQFTALTYGRPGYGQLSGACPAAISAGAEGEGEMGAFSFLQQPRRLTNLRTSLGEYLRFGLEAGIFHAT